MEIKLTTLQIRLQYMFHKECLGGHGLERFSNDAGISVTTVEQS